MKIVRSGFAREFTQRATSAQPQVKRLMNPTPPKTIAGGPGLPDDGFLRKYLPIWFSGF